MQIFIAAFFSAALPLLAVAAPPTGPFEAKHCAPENAKDPILYQSDFKWNYEQNEIGPVYEKLYNSEKRMSRRAYLDARSGKFKLPWYKDQGGDVELPISFVENVVRHIEAAFEKGVAEYVLFPDLGHSHFFIPDEKYEREYKDLNPMSAVFSKMLKDPEVKVFYHTYEQMRMLDEHDQVLPDPHIQFRHKYRNLVGHNNGSSEIFFLQNPESPANTAGKMDGYYYWGSGFNINASKNGCFYYTHKGQRVYFDLSLFDLAYPM